MNDVRTPGHVKAIGPGHGGAGEMDTAELRRRVDAIDRKLDVILEEIELQRRHRREVEDLKADLMRVGKGLYDSAVVEPDQKGYFEFLAELVRVGDTVVTSFTPEDVRRLGENVVTILQTVKSLSQEDVLNTVNNGLAVYRQLSIDVPEKVSTWQLLRELNTPEMRRGLTYLIRFQKSLLSLEAEDRPAAPEPVKTH